MNNYFTSIERTNDLYVGTVHDANTNQAVYKTAAYPSHTDAIIDINNYLQNTPHTITAPAGVDVSAPAEFVHTQADEQPAAEQPVRRCCGR